MSVETAVRFSILNAHDDDGRRQSKTEMTRPHSHHPHNHQLLHHHHHRVKPRKRSFKCFSSSPSRCSDVVVTLCVVTIVTVIFQAQMTHQKPVKRRSATITATTVQKDSLTDAMMYLMKYGYMDHHHHHNSGKSAQLLSPDGLKNYLMDFQTFAGINRTGVLDDETIRWMNMPRCGVKDNVGGGGGHAETTGSGRSRRKRYALQGSRWRVKELSYKISRYPTKSGLSRSAVDREIKKALSVWSDHTDLNFVRKRSGKVHIDIRFEKGEHGDGDPFDGAGGTLAHAFFPVFGGDAHFDDDEPWTINTFRGTSLLQTAAHEFGHSLGLSHSDDKSALMAPFYRGFETKPKLEKDDIKGIQALYGTKSTSSKPEVDTNFIEDERVPTQENELCKDSKLDAIVTVKDTTTYAFKGSKYWKLIDDGVAPGYPKAISADWQGLPSDVDAAFTWTNGKTYIFKGAKYWRFTNRDMDAGYPKAISKGFDGIPDNVDAAFVWSGNGKIYFFKGVKYYRFDPEARPPVKPTYPKPVENWEGIPGNIDDALQYKNGYTYFFKRGRYWRFDDKNFGIDKADPPFPRQTSYWWFGCEKRDNASR